MSTHWKYHAICGRQMSIDLFTFWLGINSCKIHRYISFASSSSYELLFRILTLGIHFQMIGCKTRGYSFTRALLGLAADELHLCGDAAAVALVEDIVKVTGDDLEVPTSSFYL